MLGNLASTADDMKRMTAQQLIEGVQRGHFGGAAVLAIAELADRKARTQAKPQQPGQDMSVAEKVVRDVSASGIGSLAARQKANALAPEMQAMNVKNGSMEPFAPHSILSRETPIDQRGYAKGGIVGYANGDEVGIGKTALRLRPVNAMNDSVRAADILRQGVSPGDRELYELLYSGRSPVVDLSDALPEVPEWMTPEQRAYFNTLNPDQQQNLLTSGAASLEDTREPMTGSSAFIGRNDYELLPELVEQRWTVPEAIEAYENWEQDQPGMTYQKGPLDPSHLLPTDEELLEASPPGMTPGMTMAPAGTLDMNNLLPTPAELAPQPQRDASTPTTGGGGGGGGGGGAGSFGGIFGDYEKMIRDRMAQLDADTKQNQWLMVAKFGASLIGQTTPGPALQNAAEDFLALRQQNRDEMWQLQEAMMGLRLKQADMIARARSGAARGGGKKEEAGGGYGTDVGRSMDDLKALIDITRGSLRAIEERDSVTGEVTIPPERQDEYDNLKAAEASLVQQYKDAWVTQSGPLITGVIEVPE